MGLFLIVVRLPKIVPIFKSGDVSDYKIYRPISILPAISKLFGKLTLFRLSSFLTKHHILHESQHGFQTNHSTCTAAMDLLNEITKNLDKKYLTLGLFIDISKAFDSINHDILLSKLEYYGIRGVANSWFHSYITNRFQYIESANSSSLLRPIIAGVPQGSILGLILYILYVNDIFSVCIIAKCVIYTDDTTILISSSSINDLMAESVNILTQFFLWFCANKLALNDKKTKYVIFSSSVISHNDHNNWLVFDSHTVTRSNFV